MTTPAHIQAYIESLTGHPLNRDEGVQHGDAERDVTAATVAWMASPEAIRSARENGANFMIVHESLYYPYDVVNVINPPVDWRDWRVNRQRRELLETAPELTLMRVHGSADEICIFDTFAERLGLGTPVFAEGLAKVYEIPPCPLRVLVERVKTRVGMQHVRVANTGDADCKISRIGLPWGGMGLFINVGYQQQLIAQGCDVFIAGESDNYGFRFAAECGIPMIETSHEVSENPGLRRFTGMLNNAFPNVHFAFYENECVWQMR